MANLGPGTHDPKHVSHVSRSAPFSMTAKSGKGPAVDDGKELSAKIRNVQKKKRDQEEEAKKKRDAEEKKRKEEEERKRKEAEEAALPEEERLKIQAQKEAEAFKA